MHREEVREKSVRVVYLSCAKRSWFLKMDRLYHIMRVGKKESVITGLVVLKITLAISLAENPLFPCTWFRKSTFSLHRH